MVYGHLPMRRKTSLCRNGLEELTIDLTLALEDLLAVRHSQTLSSPIMATLSTPLSSRTPSLYLTRFSRELPSEQDHLGIVILPLAATWILLNACTLFRPRLKTSCTILTGIRSEAVSRDLVFLPKCLPSLESNLHLSLTAVGVVDNGRQKAS